MKREHCRFVGKGIEKAVADGEDLNAKFEGQITMLRFKLEKDGGRIGIIIPSGGELVLVPA